MGDALNVQLLGMHLRLTFLASNFIISDKMELASQLVTSPVDDSRNFFKFFKRQSR